MCSKLYLYWIRPLTLSICALSFFQCEDDNRITSPPVLSSDDFEFQDDLVNGISFVGTLPNGQFLDFQGANTSSGLGAPNFSNAQGLGFTNPQSSLNVGASLACGFGEMILGDSKYEFQFVWSVTYGELRRRYPIRFNTDPRFDHLILYLGLGQHNYNEQDVIRGTYFNVDNHIRLTIDPRRSTNNIRSGIAVMINGNVFELDGIYNQDKYGITSEGKAWSLQTSYVPYRIELTCDR